MTDNKKVIGLHFGRPAGDVIEDCTSMLLEATKSVLHEKTDVYDIFKYGDDGGDKDCREMLAKFLSRQYGTTVSCDNLLITAGATHGLNFLMSTLMGESKVVMVEDPTYFFAIPLLRDDLRKTVVPVPRDAEGMIPEVLEDLLTAHKPKDWRRTESGPQYWTSVYFVPTFNNPTSQTYSNARLQKLVAIARKHQVLLISEDLYQFLSFSEEQKTTKSMLQVFDKTTDPDYDGGHLVINCSFSKLIAPGLRLGWIEGPKWLTHKLSQTIVSKSGGCFNQYTSKLVAQIIRNGRQQEQVTKVRKIYKKRMDAMVKALREHLPKGCSFEEPEGGYYVWLEMHPKVNANDLQKFSVEKHSINFSPGPMFSPSGGCKNFARLCIAPCEEDELIEGTKRFCQAYKDFLAQHNIGA